MERGIDMIESKKLICLVLAITLVFSLITMSTTTTVLADETTTVTLQPNATDGKDGNVNDTPRNKQKNYGTCEYMECGRFDDEHINRAYIEFDLTSLPVGVEIDNAIFSVYQSGYWGQDAVPSDYAIYKVTETWNEGNRCNSNAVAGEICWNLQPSFDSIAYGLTNVDPLNPFPKWIDFDVSSLVRDWYDGTATNYGMVIKLVNEANDCLLTLSSSDYSNSNYWPKLTITYHIPESSAPVPSQPPAPEGEVETVGVDVFTVDKTGLIAPWITLGVILLAGGIFLVRRKAHSNE